MATCKDCIHYEVCKTEKGSTVFYREGLLESTYNQVDKLCGALFKDKSRFVELPFPISEGTKLYYIFEEIDGKIVVGKDRTTVTRVCKDGFYVSGRIHSDGTYQQDDEFYPWDAIGTEYFFTLEEAERVLNEYDF